MGEASTAASKRTVIDALVLAFSHSDVREIVGTDALRSVLSVEYRDLTASGSLELQAVWDLLAQQPGFQSDHALGPMLVIKQWERRLGIPVVLPDAVASLSEGEKGRLASQVSIPTPELRKLFRTDLVDAETERREAKKRASGERPKIGPKTSAKKQSRPALVAIAAVVALAGFAYAGYSVYKRMNTQAEWKSVGAGDFAGDLPIAKAERFGSQIGATLTDKGWLGTPEAGRRAQLQAALEKLRAKGVQVLFLKDGKRVVATVQYSAKTESYSFTFPKTGK